MTVFLFTIAFLMIDDYRFTIIFLNSSVYFAVLFPDIFLFLLLVFYFVIFILSYLFAFLVYRQAMYKSDKIILLILCKL